MSRFDLHGDFHTQPHDHSGIGRRVGLILLLILGAAMVYVAFEYRHIFKNLHRAWRGVPPHQALDRPLEQLDLRPIEGGPAVTLADLRGRVAVIAFILPSEPDARDALAWMAAAQRQFSGKDNVRILVVLCGKGIEQDPAALRDQAEALLRGHPVRPPLYYDPDHATRLAFDTVGRLSRRATTFVLDGNGIIRGVWVGNVEGTEEELLHLVEQLAR